MLKSACRNTVDFTVRFRWCHFRARLELRGAREFGISIVAYGVRSLLSCQNRQRLTAISTTCWTIDFLSEDLSTALPTSSGLACAFLAASASLCTSSCSDHGGWQRLFHSLIQLTYGARHAVLQLLLDASRRLPPSSLKIDEF